MVMNDILFAAASFGEVPGVEALRASGVDIIGSRRDDGLSSIILASRNGHTRLLDYLLYYGADANDQEYYGGTCLVAAACFRHPDCVRRLIDAGADTSYAYSGDNATIIYMAVICFKKDVEGYGEEDDIFFDEGSLIRTVKLLLGAGAPGHTKQDDGSSSSKTALQVLRGMSIGVAMEAIKRERDGLIALLQEHTDP
mmetsp:Transcript_24194/g.52170  ORF Transcript_24194/g.52170 Transcript_24194/m.52170 type:complete len:197 (+) Transcript_24194:181-771(+)|eukprot:CAMPEP_0172315872 /NCGR_PEP_ID=MMETSP1058-20130122/26541_1 /TAXON_ID=83371 /ORGANISM="Detonula confervacea, Strain CCMP 353" /LENGTH=196 /DNA_ID=CAMNT_0013030053 /DNA_START=157 /DNA_END=747 /DNA_ORIENTATION=-